MFGASIFDYLHPEDLEKVREQLSTQEPQNSGRILDLKTGTVKKEGHQCEFPLLYRHVVISHLYLGLELIGRFPRIRLSDHGTRGAFKEFQIIMLSLVSSLIEEGNNCAVLVDVATCPRFSVVILLCQK